jgi:hypothetical protein
MPKRNYTLIAEHFGTDSDSIRESEYQYGRFTKSVYSLSDNEYWSAGATPPRHTDSVGNPWKWEKVISGYDRKSILWRRVGSDDDDD